MPWINWILFDRLFFLYLIFRTKSILRIFTIQSANEVCDRTFSVSQIAYAKFLNQPLRMGKTSETVELNKKQNDKKKVFWSSIVILKLFESFGITVTTVWFF